MDFRSAWALLATSTGSRSVERRPGYSLAYALPRLSGFPAHPSTLDFYQAILFGPTIAPLIGGLTSHFFSWRVLQYGLGGYSFLTLVLTYFLQPETSQPGARGVDKLIEQTGKASWVWLNPFRALALLRSPNVALLVGTVSYHL